MQPVADTGDPHKTMSQAAAALSKILPDDISVICFLQQRQPGGSLRLTLAGGAGRDFEAESKRQPDKWQSGRAVEMCPSADTLSGEQEVATSLPQSTDHDQISPILELTRSILTRQVSYRGNTLGFFMAVSRNPDLGYAFPQQVRQRLRLVADYVGIFLGRHQLLTASMTHLFGHGLLRPLHAAVLLVQRLRGSLHPSGEAAEELAMLASTIEQANIEVGVWYKTWRIASGDLGALAINQPFDVGKVVDRAVRVFHAHAPEVEVKQVQKAPGVECQADEEIVTSCLLELLDNARKFRVAKTPIRVSTRAKRNHTGNPCSQRWRYPRGTGLQIVRTILPPARPPVSCWERTRPMGRCDADPCAPRC